MYTSRAGSGTTLLSACAGFALQGQPPATLPVTSFGQGLTYRYVLTPQVWAISGDGLSLGFDGRTADPTVAAEIAHRIVAGPDIIRFTINQPSAGGSGFDYLRLANVAAPVSGVARDYRCLLGISTVAADVAAAPSGPYSRASIAGTAFVRDGSSSRAFSLGRSIVTVSADFTGRRVTLSVRVIGTPEGGGADVELGTVAGSAAIDPANGNFTAPLTSTTRTISGSITGRFFGPAAGEIGAIFGATVADAPGAAGFTIAGGAFGAR